VAPAAIKLALIGSCDRELEPTHLPADVVQCSCTIRRGSSDAPLRSAPLRSAPLVVCLGLIAFAPDVARAGSFGWGTTGCVFNTVAAAKNDADSNGGPNATIWGLPGIYNLNGLVSWSNGHTLRPGNPTCSANDSGTLVFVAAANNRAFKVDSTSSLTIYNTLITGGAPSSGYGGNILVETDATLELHDVSLTAGTSTFGGCVYGDAGSVLDFTDVVLDSCTAAGGGGIYLTGASADLTNVTITDSVATVPGYLTGIGGGLVAEDCDVVIDGDSLISRNTADYEAGGIYTGSFLAPSVMTIAGTTEISLNESGEAGGGLEIKSRFGESVTVDIEEDVLISENTAAYTGGGMEILDHLDDGVVNVQFRDNVEVYANEAENGAGAFVVSPGIFELLDLVKFDLNVAEFDGGGVYQIGGSFQAYGATVTAPDAVDTGDTDGGVVFASNSAGGTGSALYASGVVIEVANFVAEHHDSTAIELLPNGETPSDMSADLSHFNSNEAVFHVGEDCTLLVETEWGEAGCDIFSVGDFDPDRYCSEITANTGKLLLAEADSVSTIRTTSLMWNTLPAADEIAVEVKDDAGVEFTTCMVGDNLADGLTAPSLVEVQSGGDFDAKNSTFADVGIPVRYLSGATGDFRRNAAYDSGAGVAVKVNAAATVTGNENLGDWDRIISGTNNTDPGWVTLPRGDFHLNALSTVLDICTTDGDWDIEGTARPQPAGDWDAGAIELPVIP
jgi:predicted outer membrane repeat protein